MFATLSPRTSRVFGRRNGAGGITSREPLSMDRIRSVAPSVFADARHDSRSERYTYIPTSQIVEWMTKNGYGVFSASQSGSRDETKRGHTKHMLRFRRLDAPFIVGQTLAEMVLVNSHDGTSAYNLMAGLFRPVCTNGLVVSAGVIEDVRIPHKGNILEDVSSGIETLSRQLPMIADSVGSMARIELSPPEQGAFARAALSLKYDDAPPVSESQVLAVRRAEDAAPTLWNTLNRVQEALVKGGDRYRLETPRGTQRRQTQPVNSVDGQTRVNRAIWQLAEEMRKLKS
jgi:hypothetical protein